MHTVLEHNLVFCTPVDNIQCFVCFIPRSFLQENNMLTLRTYCSEYFMCNSDRNSSYCYLDHLAYDTVSNSLQIRLIIAVFSQSVLSTSWQNSDCHIVKICSDYFAILRLDWSGVCYWNGPSLSGLETCSIKPRSISEKRSGCFHGVTWRPYP